MLLPLLWTLASAQASPCALLEVDTAVTWKAQKQRRGTRLDRLLLRAEDARPDCALLHIPDLPGSRLTDLSVRVIRAEQRAIRLGADRLVPTEGGWTLHLPELSEGAVLRLSIARDLLEPWTLWAPAWSGMPEWTRLTVRPDSERVAVDALGPAAWMPTHSATATASPSAPSSQARLVVAPGASAPPRFPSEETSPAEVGALLSRRVELVLEVAQGVRRSDGEPPAGRSLWTETLTGSGGALPREVAFPPGATGMSCSVEGSDAAAVLSPWGCTFPAMAEGGPQLLRWSWEEPRLVLADERSLASTAGPVAQAELRIEGRGGRVIAEGIGGAEMREDKGVIVIFAKDAKAGQDAPGARFRLAEADGAPVLPDRAAALNAIARLAVHASMPEPALPLEFKNLKGDADAVPEVLRLVRQRARTASLPTRGPLSPRPLSEIKRSGWASPWEQALLLTRYLRQLRLDAVPVPLRPATLRPADPASPAGFGRAAVLLHLGEQDQWLDPTCLVCAPGELAPDLWGAQALAAGIVETPAGPAAQVQGSVDGSGALTLQLSPPAALVLRLALLESAPGDRGARLPALLGLPKATLLQQEGLGAPGQPVTLRLAGAAGAGPLTWAQGRPLGAAGAQDGPNGGWLPFSGALRVSRPWPDAQSGRSEQVLAPGLIWRGRVQTDDQGQTLLAEELLIDQPRLAAGVSPSFDAALALAWQRLTAAPPPLAPMPDPLPDAPPAPETP